ncbi:hypothetical protein J5U18_03520 [Sphingobacteriaceae bacterium WQ 2009]|uniref:WG containing repeat-containing protein n=1 Tax=Rhinopithecimicrobium faecis TaxID=2820698 RepID=A0A8T4H708_9SPHI|nr:hypothetical protein [Sphingobacteriaceae bacterium WQ 2009]
MTALAQNTAFSKNTDAVNWIPYLTKNNNFIYVDKNLKKQPFDSFTKAEKFTETGYALVGNDKSEIAIIDSKGKFVLDFTHYDVEIQKVNNVTLMMKELEYDKKMPLWKWDWNIMGGDIQKTQTYRKIEIRVLETNQVLFEQDVPLHDKQYNFNIHHLDEDHVVLNDILFEIKNSRFQKIKSRIALTLEDGRYVPASDNSFEIHSIKNKKPLLSNLIGTQVLNLTVNKQAFVLDSINMDRYAPLIPKTLQDTKSNDVYVYPQYDKVFPKEIINASARQINFLENVSLLYSVNNTPYFILGRFNYDHDIWAYDWLYVDEYGNLLTEINVKNFFILDQIGRAVWPDKKMIISKNEVEKDYKIGNIFYVNNSEILFLVEVIDSEKKSKRGLWNSNTKSWEIEPQYQSIHVLDSKKGIFALQKVEKGTYQLYNNKMKQQIGTSAYQWISSDGAVQVDQENQERLYFYIDIETGKEYRD